MALKGGWVRVKVEWTRPVGLVVLFASQHQVKGESEAKEKLFYFSHLFCLDVASGKCSSDILLESPLDSYVE